MDHAACLAWLRSDPDRLARLNHIRERAGVDVWTVEQAADVMSCLGGCTESDFRAIESRVG